MRIFRKFGADTVGLLQATPYLLCGEGVGLGFGEADRIAEGFGGDFEAARSRAGIAFVLQHNLKNGHTFIPFGELCRVSAGLLEKPAGEIEGVMGT
jgi:exodeoxyribonuclease V alpha subunit